MDGLPTELKAQVSVYLDIRSLKSIRQAGRAWADVSTSLLFHEIWVTSSSVAELVAMSRHEILRQHVNVLVFSPLRLPFILPEDWYDASYAKSDALDAKEIGNRYERYVHHHNKQRRFSVEKWFRAIRSSCKMFEKLHTIHIARRRCEGLDNIGRSSSPPQLWSNIWKDLNDLGYCELSMEGLSQSCSIFYSVLLLLHATPFVRTFVAGTLPLLLWSQYPMEERPRLENCFKNLRVLRLDITGLGDWYTNRTINNDMSCFGCRLTEAAALEEFTLHVRSTPWSVLSPVDLLLDFRPDWPRLKTMKLSGVSTTNGSLDQLLARYQQTLTTLALCNIELIPVEGVEGTWPLVFRKLIYGDWIIKQVHLWDLSYVGGRDFAPLEASYLKDMEQAILSRIPLQVEQNSELES